MPLANRHLVDLPRTFPDCPCCGRDLAGLADHAMFCPGCGNRLREQVTRRQKLQNQGAKVLYYCSFGKLGHHDQTAQNVDPGVCCTPILIGYSNALFSLGWRYERGGAGRNLPEAIRCYRKSARLGNLDAIVRLAPSESIAPKPVIPIQT